MSEDRHQSSRSLTGIWQGIYSYPPGTLPAVSFTATLIEAGRSLSGSVHEPCTMGGKPGETLFFTLSGSRRGTAVDLVKSYHGANRYYGTILYAGTVNDDATEIEGRWAIPGDWSGRFLMTRSGDQPRAAAESAGAEAGVERAEPASSGMWPLASVLSGIRETVERDHHRVEALVQQVGEAAFGGADPVGEALLRLRDQLGCDVVQGVYSCGKAVHLPVKPRERVARTGLRQLERGNAAFVLFEGDSHGHKFIP
jgi:hypothetical protein